MSKRKLLRARRGRPRARLGRSAHADARGAAPARLLARGDPRVLRHDRRREGELDGRHRQARVLRARRSQSERAARARRAAADRGRGRPARSTRSDRRRAVLPARRRQARLAAAADRAIASTSIATTGATTRRPTTSGSRPAARCACATATASPPTRSSRATRRRGSYRVHARLRGGKNAADGGKGLGVIHWVDAATSVPAEVAAVRSAVQGAAARGGRRRLPRAPRSGVARDRRGCARRAVAREGRGRLALAARARRLLPRRRGHASPGRSCSTGSRRCASRRATGEGDGRAGREEGEREGEDAAEEQVARRVPRRGARPRRRARRRVRARPGARACRRAGRPRSAGDRATAQLFSETAAKVGAATWRRSGSSTSCRARSAAASSTGELDGPAGSPS